MLTLSDEILSCSHLSLSVRLLEKIHHLTIIRHLAKGFITYPGNSSSAINDYKRSRHFKEIQIIFRVYACKVPISICGWNIVQREQVMTPNFELVKDGDVYNPHWWHFYFQCPLEGFLYICTFFLQPWSLNLQQLRHSKGVYV